MNIKAACGPAAKFTGGSHAICLSCGLPLVMAAGWVMGAGHEDGEVNEETGGTRGPRRPRGVGAARGDCRPERTAGA